MQLEPGQIRICFEHPTQALEKLLALAMAIGNDHEGFEQRTATLRARAEEDPEPQSVRAHN